EFAKWTTDDPLLWKNLILSHATPPRVFGVGARVRRAERRCDRVRRRGLRTLSEWRLSHNAGIVSVEVSHPRHHAAKIKNPSPMQIAQLMENRGHQNWKLRNLGTPMLCKSYVGATGPVPSPPTASSTLNQRAAFPGSPLFLL